MKPGHADAQFLFEVLGRKSGYGYRRTWSRELPTDGVWIIPPDLAHSDALPVVALEVVVSEGPKSVRGSIDTLSEVSPALGLLVINEVEIRRSFVRRGSSADDAEKVIATLMAFARNRIARCQQRIEAWTYAQLRRRYELVTGDQSPVFLQRLSSSTS